ncbi:hypothetical protein Rumeso_01985 [Rubellimicrobium mesophilum DSM 19309]|uniref:Caspase family p20 domain-containing protein n=1 Tax=Rubellimicrobium mesophilum DSM 19309 TaxID=442562 RepID=A0A017HPJ9_9RHOB|nr:caspase family protein [Rubellimicrobium mesophilum]EYD76427.1 hypothetical protein Rumeso_01985 [Rubellimicrobium mesophilum DSM 19309]
MFAGLSRRLGLALVVLLAVTPMTAMAERMALVIGMADYQHTRPLNNTVNDARAIAAELEDIGVEVTLSTDATRDELLQTMSDFAFRSETADLALIYFAGHGVEVQGENYLIPVDAEVHSARDVQQHAVSLEQFMDTVRNARVMRVVILDACRDNPYSDLIETRTATSTSSEGGRRRGARAAAGLPP